MTWDAHHRRGEVLRAVIDEANTRRDGTLPLDVPGVAETFGGDLDLIGALQLRWHTRLNGAIERALLDQPSDPEPAVVSAWRSNATALAGVRAVLDTYADQPTSTEMAEAMQKARIADWRLLAAMAGDASASGDRAVTVGRRLEEQARAGHRPGPTPVPSRRRSTRPGRKDRERGTLLGRLRTRRAA